ncbi:YraN family protein [Patescibacteria group bacterium]
MSTYQQHLGKIGEFIACDYLIQKGYRIIDQHVTSREGELDLVADQFGELVFVEVKTRSSVKFGSSEESITTTKLKRLTSAIGTYISNYPEHTPYRLDCICVFISNFKAEISHYYSCG